MPLRSGKKYLKIFFPIEEQPFKLILLPEHHIDFYKASKAWRQNKIYLGGGQFEYKVKPSSY
jgi:hypothetical protein